MKYGFKNEADSATLKIYEEIQSGDEFWGITSTSEEVENQLAEAGNKPLNIYINSYGGEVFEGFAIYNLLKRYAGYKTVYIDGIAASIASVIAMAGDKIVVSEASMMMVHNASGVCYGNAEEMKKVVQALENINESIKDIYMKRVNITREKLDELMANETFMTAKDCLEYGFADEQIDYSEKNINDAMNTLNSMKDVIEQKIKMFNDIKKLGFEAPTQVGGNPVDDDGNALNNKAHWDWLKNGGMK